jgi:uncharacterized membrane protein
MRFIREAGVLMPPLYLLESFTIYTTKIIGSIKYYNSPITLLLNIIFYDNNHYILK